jgi:hypothetical protein
MLDEIDRDLAALYARYDQTQSRDDLAKIRAILNRRRYIENLIEKL